MLASSGAMASMLARTAEVAKPASGAFAGRTAPAAVRSFLDSYSIHCAACAIPGPNCSKESADLGIRIGLAS